MPSWWQPTSSALIGTCAAIGVVVLGWALFWVPTHRSEGWGGIAQQFLALLATVLLAMLLTGLLLNRSNDWYPSWSSLGRTPRGPVSVATFGAPANDLPVAPRPWQSARVDRRLADPRTNPVFAGLSLQDPAPHGNYLTVAVTGPASHVTTDVLVWLPPSYLSHPDRRYPVILAFPGIPGSINQYRRSLPVATLLPELSQHHQLREAIVIVPDVFPANQDTECVDASNGSILMDTFVSTDLVAWARANLRVAETPDAWATFGFSAGGWCASMLSLRHPQLFGHALNMSGYFQLHFDGPALTRLDDPAYDLGRIARDQAPDVDLWFWSARDDRMSMDSLPQFEPTVRAPTTLTTALLESGGHTWPVWTMGASVGLRWLGRNSPDFAWVGP